MTTTLHLGGIHVLASRTPHGGASQRIGAGKGQTGDERIVRGLRRVKLIVPFVEKAEAALVAAVEVFNKPSFRYREETFALLAINAWELLLKAQLLKRGANDPKVIRVYEPRRTKAGKPSNKLYLKRTRAGAPLTLSLLACVASLDKDPATRVDAEIRANLEALIAIRDNAAHYINASAILAKQVLEVASASVKNFITRLRHTAAKITCQ